MGNIVKYICKSCGYEPPCIYEGVGRMMQDAYGNQMWTQLAHLMKLGDRHDNGKLPYDPPVFVLVDDVESIHMLPHVNTNCDVVGALMKALCESGICPKCRKRGTLEKHGVGRWD